MELPKATLPNESQASGFGPTAPLRHLSPDGGRGWGSGIRVTGAEAGQLFSHSQAHDSHGAIRDRMRSLWGSLGKDFCFCFKARLQQGPNQCGQLTPTGAGGPAGALGGRWDGHLSEMRGMRAHCPGAGGTLVRVTGGPLAIALGPERPGSNCIAPEAGICGSRERVSPQWAHKSHGAPLPGVVGVHTGLGA